LTGVSIRRGGVRSGQRDVIVSLVKRSEGAEDKAYAKRTLDVVMDMQRCNSLHRAIAWMIEDLKRRVGR
jgi:hypothetical protein